MFYSTNSQTNSCSVSPKLATLIGAVNCITSIYQDPEGGFDICCKNGISDEKVEFIGLYLNIEDMESWPNGESHIYTSPNEEYRLIKGDAKLIQIRNEINKMKRDLPAIYTRAGIILNDKHWRRRYSEEEARVIVFSMWVFLRNTGAYNMIMDREKYCEKHNIPEDLWRYVKDHFSELSKQHPDVLKFHSLIKEKRFYSLLNPYV